MHLTIIENIRMVVALLKAHHIRHIVVSPGGTNIPFVHAVEHDDFFVCYNVVDERSAIYFAIGLYNELGVPIATTCTSAQATRNYIPGLTEAYYKHVPILAITASKHPRFTYQEYMQAPDQTSLPSDAVKKSYNLPHIDNGADKIMCERLINEAILELTHHGLGPVQLNVPIYDNERLVFEETELPLPRVISRYNTLDDWGKLSEDQKFLIVAGESIGYDEKEVEAIENFCATHQAVVYTNHLSNLHCKYSVAGNLLMSTLSQSEFNTEFKPDIVITIGGQIGDYSIFGKISSCPSIEHWRVNVNGDVVDPYDKLTKIFECEIVEFFARFEGLEIESFSYLNKWESAMEKLNYNVDLPLSNIFIAQQLCGIIPKGSCIEFAILNSLRSWLMFPLDASIRCFSPVAAFGIDGGLSMLIGQSFVSDSFCFMITGDLAFFYDMNSLGIRGIKNNVRVVLINNSGGAEFTMYGRNNIDDYSNISAIGHNSSAKGWAESCGFEYLCARTKDDVSNVLEKLVSQSVKPIFCEVFTTMDEETKSLGIMLRENSHLTVLQKLKHNVRRLIGV